MKSTEHNSFKNEAMETIGRIETENSNLFELKWFLETALLRFDESYLKKTRPQVIVLGNDIPAEVLYAVCDHPFYVLGGSLGTAHWADELTPRDTDPFSRSTLGWLINPDFDITKNALIVTATSSDSRRKLISVLQSAGRQVAAMDVPPMNNTSNAIHYYKDQMVMLAEKIGKYTHKHLTGGNLRRAVRKVARAHRQWQRFTATAYAAKGFISDEAVLLVTQCMYFADSLDEWALHVADLTKELEALNKRFMLKQKEKPNVLILGSPVVFPNYKVPQLIASANMRIAAVADCLSLEAALSVKRGGRMISADRILDQIAQDHLRATSSGARVNNEGLYSYFLHLVDQLRPDGIVCHILKGQIEYDFELPYIEKAAEELDIPVFRLETDYQYQDMEQLRIRMEAFGEMLNQRNIVKRKASRSA
ncbi:2-hydroxyacyl-CoA dehydratase subunit D [Ruminococcus sp.]|uniref:2-hydroxyacyl-CoA dehydratase subunit D n=1 Tax=Ruminococcus sp. TaxID=41978 RepID=UPI0038636A0A